MINKWQKIVLKDIYDRRQIPFGVLEKFEALTKESPVEDYQEIFEKLGYTWQDILEYVEEVEDYERREFIYDYFKSLLPLKQSILEIKKSLLDFEVWNHLMYMFDHHHDSLRHREEVMLKYIHESESEWKYQKLARLDEKRPQLIAKQKARRHELELKELNNIELTPKEKKEIKYYKDFDQFQIDHKNNVLSDMLRMSGGDEELGFAGINFDADFKEFNNPEFVEEIREMKADAAKKIQDSEKEAKDKIYAIKQAKADLERKLTSEYENLEQKKEEELQELDAERQQELAELAELSRERIENEIKAKESEMSQLIEQFEEEKSSILEEYEVGINEKLGEIEGLNEDILTEQGIQEEIKKRNEEEITRLKAEWELIQNKNVIADLESATKKELILLAQSLQITVPSIDTQKTLRRKIMERVDQLQLRYNDSDLEEMIEARILELQGANDAIDASANGEGAEAGGDAFGGGGDAFGGGGDAFGGGGDAFGGGGDAFGGGGDAFGGGGDAFGGGGDAFGGGGDAFGGGGDAFGGGGGDAFGGGGDAFGGGGDAFGGGGDDFGGGGDAFGGGGDSFGGGGDAFGGGGDAFGGGDTPAPAEDKKPKQKADKYADYPLPEDWDEYTDKDKKIWLKEYEKSKRLAAKEAQSKKAKAAMEAEIKRQVEEKVTQELLLRQEEFEKKVEHIENVDAKSINTKAADAEDKLKSIIDKLGVLHSKDDELEKIHNHEWTGEEEKADSKPREVDGKSLVEQEEAEAEAAKAAEEQSNSKADKKKSKKEKKSKKSKGQIDENPSNDESSNEEEKPE